MHEYLHEKGVHSWSVIVVSRLLIPSKCREEGFQKSRAINRLLRVRKSMVHCACAIVKLAWYSSNQYSADPNATLLVAWSKTMSASDNLYQI